MSRFADVRTFIEEAKAVESRTDLQSLMEAITREMGFSAFALFQHVKRWDWADASPLAMSNYPRAWIEQFHGSQLQVRDPVHLASYRSLIGFKWQEIGDLIDMNRAQRSMLANGRRAGIHDGFTVPAHIPGETEGSVTFVVGAGQELPDANLPMAQLIGHHAYECARRLARRERQMGDAPRAKLTGRELDCIVLVAKGKSDWEIGSILGLSENTVTTYLTNAKAKFGDCKRTQLVIRALHEGHFVLSDVLK